MPSQALQELSTQIEQQQTDNFGKFYLYATLLNTMTVRKQSFVDAMPVYQSMENSAANTLKTSVNGLFGTVFNNVGEDDKIKTGGIDSDFSGKLTNYAEQYANPLPNVLRVSLEIFWTFLRRGKLNDLIFVIQKMDAHLNTSPITTTAHNQDIYNKISFQRREADVKELLKHARHITKHAQDTVDCGALTVTTVIAALVALEFTMAFGGVFLSLAMLTAGACTAYYFIQCAIVSFNQIEAAVSRCEILFQTMVDQQTANLYSPNHLNFIIKGIMAPIVYTGVTVREQLQAVEEDVISTKQERQSFNRQFEEIENKLSISLLI